MKNPLFAISGATLVLLLAFSIFGGIPASAAANPAGQGQPSAECGDTNATVMPNGFSSGGFAHAEEVYAGSDGAASTMHSQSAHAVSQYDVACYQLTSNH